MKILRLALLGAAAYGVKKWLDENPDAKRQVMGAADTAKEQAKHAAGTVKQEVEHRRHRGEEHAGGPEDLSAGAPTGSMFGSSAGTAAGDYPSAAGPTGSEGPGLGEPTTPGDRTP